MSVFHGLKPAVYHLHFNYFLSLYVFNYCYSIACAKPLCRSWLYYFVL